MLSPIWLVRTEFSHTLGVETSDRLYVNSDAATACKDSLLWDFPVCCARVDAPGGKDANDDAARGR